MLSIVVDGSRWLAGANRVRFGPAGFCPDPCTAGFDDFSLTAITVTPQF